MAWFFRLLDSTVTISEGAGNTEDFFTAWQNWRSEQLLTGKQVAFVLEMPISSEGMFSLSRALDKITSFNEFLLRPVMAPASASQSPSLGAGLEGDAAEAPLSAVASESAAALAAAVLEEEAFLKTANEIAARNRLLAEDFAVDLNSLTPDMDLWDRFIQELSRYNHMDLYGIAYFFPAGDMSQPFRIFQEKVGQTGRQGVIAWVREHLNPICRWKMIQCEIGSVVFPLSPRALLDVINTEQLAPGSSPLDCINFCFPMSHGFDMSDPQNREAFQQFLLKNKTLSIVTIALINIPDEFLRWLQTNLVTTEIMGIFDRDQEAKMKGIVLKNRREQTKQDLRAIAAPAQTDASLVQISTAVVAEAQPTIVAVKFVPERETTPLESVRQSKMRRQRKQLAMSITHQQQAQRQQRRSQQQSQSQASQQRLSSMQEEAQESALAMGKKPWGSLLDRNFQSDDQILPQGQAYRSFWDSLVGRVGLQQPPVKVTKITLLAMMELHKYQAHFSYGLPPLDNLPQGFSLVSYQEDGKTENALCFDPKIPARKNATPLTLRFNERAESVLSGFDVRWLKADADTGPWEKRFSEAGTLEKRTTLFLELMALEDAALAAQIQQNPAQRALLALIINNPPQRANPLTREEQWLTESGCLGVQVFLTKIQALPSRLQTHFLDKFIKTSDNLSEFLTRESLTALDKLAGFTEAQQIWWMALVTQHFKHNMKTPLADLTDAFVYFCNEYKKLSGESDLPPLCGIQGVQNMPVALDRLLTILRRSKLAYRDTQQFSLLAEPGLSLAQDDAYFASRYERFYVCSPEMALEQPPPLQRAPEAPRLQSYASNPLGLSPTISDKYAIIHQLTEPVDPDGVFQQSVKDCWRFIGSQRYAEDYTWYRKNLFGLVPAQNFPSSTKRLQLAILVYATTGRRFVQMTEAGISAEKDITDFLKGSYSANVLAELALMSHHINQQDSDYRPSVAEAAQMAELLKFLEADQPYLIDMGLRMESFVLKYKADAPIALRLLHERVNLLRARLEVLPPRSRERDSERMVIWALIDQILKDDAAYGLQPSAGPDEAGIVLTQRKTCILSRAICSDSNSSEALAALGGAVTALNPQALDYLHDALSKVISFGEPLPPLDNFNAFVREFVTQPHTYEEIYHELQTRFHLTLQAPNQVFVGRDLTDKMVEAATALRDKFADPEEITISILFIHGSYTIAGLLGRIIGVDVAEKFRKDLESSLQPGHAQEIPGILMGLFGELQKHSLYWAMIQQTPFYREMARTLTSSYDQDINQKVQLLQGQEQSKLTELSQWLRHFIAGGPKIDVAHLTPELLNGYEARKKQAEALIALLHKIEPDADRAQVVTLALPHQAHWFVPDGNVSLFALLTHLQEQFQSDPERNRDIGGLLAKLLTNLPTEDSEPVRAEIARRSSATQAMTNDLMDDEVDRISVLIAGSGVAARDDVVHLCVVKKEYPHAAFQPFLRVCETDVAVARHVFTLWEKLRIQPVSSERVSDGSVAGPSSASAVPSAVPRVISAQEEREQKRQEENRVALLYPLLDALNDERLSQAAKQILEALASGTIDTDTIKIIVGAYFVAPAKRVEELRDVSIAEILQKVTALSPEKRKSLALLYDAKPMPSARVLKAKITNPESFDAGAFSQAFESDPYGKRDSGWEDYSRQNLQRAQQVLSEVEVLSDPARASLDVTVQSQMDLDLRYVYAVQNKVPPAEASHPIKNFTRQEIRDYVQKCRGILTRADSSEQDKRSAKLDLLALCCEVHYRITGYFPYSTQILSVLTALSESRDVMLQVNTGEGKTLISVLTAAMQWGSRNDHAVDICSANIALAQEGFREYRDFFRYLDADVALVQASSPKGTYRRGGINFSTVSELSLYRSRCKAMGDEERPKSVSLVLDEMDQPLLDEKMQYRFAMASGVGQDEHADSIYSWIYPVVNDFIESEQFEKPVSRRQDIVNLRAALIKHADRDRLKLLQGVTDQQLDQWIESATDAKDLAFNQDFVIDREMRAGKPVLAAHILIGGRPNAEAKWSDGVHQLLQARLNKMLREETDNLVKQRARFVLGLSESQSLPQDLFPIEPELSFVDAKTSKDFLTFYRQYKGAAGAEYHARGQIVGLTATSGSEKERAELHDAEHFALYRMPPHTPSHREDLPMTLAKNKSAQHAAIVKAIKKAHKKSNQPILIHCQSIEEAEAIHQMLSQRVGDRKLQLAHGLQTASEASLIQEAGKNGTITISTIFGRGTDIKPDSSVGLLVITTHLLSERPIKQVQGRAGRQGAVGETVEIINREDYPSLKGKSGKKLSTEVLAIRRQAEKTDEAERTYKTRQVDVIAYALSTQMDKWRQLIRQAWREARSKTPGLPNVPNEDDLNRELLKMKGDLLEALSKRWTSILARDCPQTNPYAAEPQQLEAWVKEFQTEANRLWQKQTRDLQRKLPVSLTASFQERFTKLQTFELPTFDTTAVGASLPASPTTTVALSPASPTPPVSKAPLALAPMGSPERKSTSWIVAQQLAHTSRLNEPKKTALQLGAVADQFQVILDSDQTASDCARLLGKKQAEQFLIQVKETCATCHTEYGKRADKTPEGEAILVFRRISRLLRTMVKENAEAVPYLFSIFLEPIIDKVIETQNKRLTSQIQEAFVTHIGNTVAVSGNSEYLRYLLSRMRHFNFLAPEQQASVMHNWMVGELEKYLHQKISPERQVLASQLVESLRAQGGKTGSILTAALTDLRKQDHAQGRRDYSHRGRYYHVLKSCADLWRAHTKASDVEAQTMPSILKQFETATSLTAAETWRESRHFYRV